MGQIIRENSEFFCVVKQSLSRLKKDNKCLDKENKKTAKRFSNKRSVPLSKSNFLLLI